ncbi:MAG: restriction endonuclease [Chloroflexi bacterium]|nr:restriction endonuclease [Chloroflexota bacterium]
MRIAAQYSFNGGQAAVEKKYAHLFEDVADAVETVNADDHRTKSSKEKTMPGRMLFSPKSLNRAFDAFFLPRGWEKKKVPSVYSTQYYVTGYKPSASARGAFREMDFVKEKLGVEVQFGKYAFMVYNVCAKMTIFHNLGFIDTGIEIVPVKGFADHMSTGVSYFEQFVWDLEKRGIADIDIPVLILGIDR